MIKLKIVSSNEIVVGDVIIIEQDHDETYIIVVKIIYNPVGDPMEYQCLKFYNGVFSGTFSFTHNEMKNFSPPQGRAVIDVRVAHI